MRDGQFQKLLRDTQDVSEDMGLEEEPLTARKLRTILFDVEPQDAPLQLIDPDGTVYRVAGTDPNEQGGVDLIIEPTFPEGDKQ